MLPRLPSSEYADANTPTGTVRDTCRLSARSVVGLPLTCGGSAPVLLVSRPAQRSLQVPAYSVAELLYATLCHRSASENVVTSIPRPGCYQPKRQLLGGIRTHQENAPFHGARRFDEGRRRDACSPSSVIRDPGRALECGNGNWCDPGQGGRKVEKQRFTQTTRERVLRDISKYRRR